MEAEHLHAGDNLTELGIGKLAGNRRCNQCVDLIFIAVLEKVDHIQYEGLVRDRTERTLIHTCTALNALVVVDFRRLLFIHGNCFDLACILARSCAIDNGGIRADLCTGTAFHTLGFINHSNMIFVKRDCTALTDVLTAMCKTASAGVGDFITADRTFITGNVDHFNDIGIILITAHGKLDTLTEDGTFFIYTTAHRRLIAGNDLLGNVKNVLRKTVVPCVTRNLTQNLIFQMLNFGVKFPHSAPP